MSDHSGSESISSAENENLSENGLKRRVALSKIGFVAIGLSVALIGGGSLFRLFQQYSRSNHAQQSNSNEDVTSATIQPAAAMPGSLVTIKVAYFGMPTQFTGTKQEYLTLNSPVYLTNVISEVTQRHPAIIPMIGAMQILIDGNPAEPDQELSNKDELDFIPIQVGG